MFTVSLLMLVNELTGRDGLASFPGLSLPLNFAVRMLCVRRGRAWYGTAPTCDLPSRGCAGIQLSGWVRFRTRLSPSFNISRIMFAQVKFKREILRRRILGVRLAHSWSKVANMYGQLSTPKPLNMITFHCSSISYFPLVPLPIHYWLAVECIPVIILFA